MKSILCYITAMLIALFEVVDVIVSISIDKHVDADAFVDINRATSAMGFTFNNQLMILGIATIIVGIGIVASLDEDKKRWE